MVEGWWRAGGELVESWGAMVEMVEIVETVEPLPIVEMVEICEDRAGSANILPSVCL